MSDTELRALTTEVKKLTARVEALERLLQRIIQQRPVSERQLEKALRSMKRSGECAMR
jgi:septal ring factor EnvC (AmiA/AmiB activator)